MKYQQPSFTLPVSNGRMSQKEWEIRMGLLPAAKPISQKSDMAEAERLRFDLREFERSIRNPR